MTPQYCSKGHENLPGSRFCRDCGELLSPPVNQSIQSGQILGSRYRIVRQLGQGGFGRTYLAEDLNRFNESCVLKEFAPQVQGTYALQKAEELFEREAGVLYRLQHPQIPKFRELFRVTQENKGTLFLVQDFVEGHTYHALLNTRRKQGLRFNEAEVTQLLLQILPVLEYIHSLGVIHRDISPDNLILRSTDGLPVLIDFGGVKQIAATVASQFSASAGEISSTPTRLGKMGYAPHEQMQGGIVYPHSDLCALAATIMVLLTGKEPQQLLNPQTLEWDWRKEISLSPSLGSVLDKMLQPRPGDRFPSAREVLQALGHEATPVTYPPIQPTPVKTEATQAVVPPVVKASVQKANQTDPKTSSPKPTTKRSFNWLGKTLMIVGAIAFAGTIGWLGGNLWINSQVKNRENQPQPTPNNSVGALTNDSEPQPAPEFSEAEKQRKEDLRQRRRNLGIDYNFYTNLVNEQFWTKYPEERGRTLGTGSEDAKVRQQWDTVAADLLTQIDQLNLSAAARQYLGKYGESDLARAKAEANNFNVGSRTLFDLADPWFFKQFPEQRGTEFINKPLGQVWQAIVSDTVRALSNKDVLEKIVFDSGTTNKKVSGNLKPARGKIFIARLSEGQEMKVNLTTNKKTLFSIYNPTIKEALLEDSPNRSWSGKLPESGYYEFVVVSDDLDPLNYQLELTVDKLPTPKSSPSKSPEVKKSTF
jgi:serine/threonine-protein kinase